MLIAFNKPFQVLCQFTDAAGRATLAQYIDIAHVYPIGRLDHDSEGLLLLSDDPALTARIAAPRAKLAKRYLAQVDGIPSPAQLSALRAGVALKDGLSRPFDVAPEPAPTWLWPREPPIRVRATLPTSWLALSLDEGRNRQVRRTTAAVGLPTLRLIRTQIGGVTLGQLGPGDWQQLDPIEVFRAIK